MITAFDFDVRSVILKRSFDGGRFQNKTIQSVCYDRKRDRYLIGFSHNDNADRATVIRTKDLSFTDKSVEKIAEDLPLAHCNDMAYDPERDRVIVAMGDNRIGEMDPEQLTVTLIRTVSCTVWSIARYESGAYFTHDGDTGRMWDRDFQSSWIISRDDNRRVVEALGVPYDKDAKQYAGYWQGAEIIEGVPHVLYTEWGEKPGYYKSCCLVIIGEDRILRAETEFETEGVCCADGETVMVYGNIHIGGARMDLGQIKTVCGTVKGVALGTDAVTVSCAGFIPSGYKFAGAQVSMTYSGKVYQLPYMDSTGKITAWIVRAKDRKITVKANRNLGKVDLTITGTCEKK